MSKNVVIVLNSAGINQFLHSEELVGKCREKADQVATRAMDMAQVSGAEYAAFPVNAPTRGLYRVSPTNAAARKDNSDNNTLVKALFGGG